MTEPPEIDGADIDRTLRRILGSPIFARSAISSALLAYLVTEARAGRQAQIKAYSIGIDVLDKSPDFDPATDASVRVAIGRLRSALADFYASNHAANASVLIDIPKGRYEPQFLPMLTDGASMDDAQRPRAARSVGRVGIGAAAFVLLAGAVVAGWLWIDRPVPSTAATSFRDLPVIDMLAVDKIDGAPAERALLARAIRELLINDLSHIKSLRVRDMQATDPADTEMDADYVLVSNLSFGDTRLFLRLNDRNQSVLWANSIELPDTNAAFYDTAKLIVGRIAEGIGGAGGVVRQDVMERLADRSEAVEHAYSQEYRCIVLAFTYDASRDAALHDRARDCLDQLVDFGSTNSMVFAELALIHLRDWSEGSGDAGDPEIHRALELARRSVQLDPTNAVGFEQLGSALAAVDRREEAIAAYRRGLALTPWKPSLSFRLGWQIVLQGNWQDGMGLVDQGVGAAAYAPAWMRIPNVLDLFRRGDFEASLFAAERVIQLGDRRGYPLAIAAARAAGDADSVARLTARANANDAIDWSDPMGEVRRSFSNPSVIADYDAYLPPASL